MEYITVILLLTVRRNMSGDTKGILPYIQGGIYYASQDSYQDSDFKQWTYDVLYEEA